MSSQPFNIAFAIFNRNWLFCLIVVLGLTACKGSNSATLTEEEAAAGGVKVQGVDAKNPPKQEQPSLANPSLKGKWQLENTTLTPGPEADPSDEAKVLNGLYKPLNGKLVLNFGADNTLTHNAQSVGSGLKLAMSVLMLEFSTAQYTFEPGLLVLFMPDPNEPTGTKGDKGDTEPVAPTQFLKRVEFSVQTQTANQLVISHTNPGGTLTFTFSRK